MTTHPAEDGRPAIRATDSGVLVDLTAHREGVEISPEDARLLSAALSTAADQHAAAHLTTDLEGARFTDDMHRAALTLILAELDGDQQRYALTVQDSLSTVSLTQLNAHLIRLHIHHLTGGRLEMIPEVRKSVHGELLESLAARDEVGW